jgi:hypothetical protein
VPMLDQRADDARIPVEGGTASRVIDLSNPWPDQPPWAEGQPSPRLVPSQPLPEYADARHHRLAEAALERFEASGDFRHGLAALVHAILSIDVRDAGINR